VVRLFFALECPGLEVKKIPSNYVFEKSSNYHITIAFLGERSNPDFEAQRIADVCDGKLPLELEYQKLGAFQKPSNARVLWIGVKSSGINALASEVRLISESEDRPFLPHITISRFKRQTNLESLVSKHAETKFGGGIATNLILFQSELTRKGAIHTPLHLIDGNGNVSSK
jgi:2'-5' RNA ligase|tara:strand:+ start:709 stop:1221 length:513 start_codon:yes stop_codon:yes gene_type:complete